MDSLATEIFRRFGIGAIAFVIVALIAIWVVAHTNAAPGGNVSVLWGIVEYTKRPFPELTASGSTQRVAAQIDPEVHRRGSSESASEEPRNPLTLDLQHNVSTENPDEAAVVLRSERGIRELAALESDTPLHEAPSGTFFFLLVPWLEIRESENSENWRRLRVDRYRESRRSYFELHKLEDQSLHLVAFASQSEAIRAANLNGSAEVSLVASPFPWGSMTSMISIPAARIVTSRPRQLELSMRETVSVIDVVLR